MPPAAELADRVVVIADGEVVTDGPTDAVLAGLTGQMFACGYAVEVIKNELSQFHIPIIMFERIC